MLITRTREKTRARIDYYIFILGVTPHKGGSGHSVPNAMPHTWRRRPNGLGVGEEEITIFVLLTIYSIFKGFFFQFAKKCQFHETQNFKS